VCPPSPGIPTCQCYESAVSPTRTACGERWAPLVWEQKKPTRSDKFAVISESRFIPNARLLPGGEESFFNSYFPPEVDVNVFL